MQIEKQLQTTCVHLSRIQHVRNRCCHG